MHDRVYLLHVSVSPATARAARRSSSPAQQQQLVASAARLRDPRICAGPDMSDTERRSRGRDCPRSIERRQSGSSAASWHWYCRHLDACCQILLHSTSSASGDLCSPTIRIEYNEDAFISCSIGLDHPGSKLNICPDCCLYDFGSAPSRAATALGVCDVETSRTSSADPNAPSTSPWHSVFVQHGRSAECRWRRACRKHI